MKIIEQSITGKAGAALCEDGIVVTDDFVAVADGSTNKSHVHFHPTMSNGQYCMTLVCDHIKGMSAETDCATFCQGVSEVVRAVYPRPQAAPEGICPTLVCPAGVRWALSSTGVERPRRGGSCPAPGAGGGVQTLNRPSGRVRCFRPPPPAFPHSSSN